MSSIAGKPEPAYPARRLARSRMGTAVVFVLLGVMQGTLASRMPAIKSHAGLSDGLLGLALLGVPAGSILAVQVTGRWIARSGSSPVTNASVIVMCLSIVTPPLATGFVALLGSLILVGIGIGLTDTAMNTHAVTVERAYRRPIMSSFHGFASLGALLGSAGGALFARQSVAPQAHFAVIGGVALVIGIAVRTSLLPGSADAHSSGSSVGADGSAPARRTPWTRPLVLLAGIALLAWMTEHAIGDWSAVYLRDQVQASASVAAYGFTAFALMMVITRFLADRLTVRLGPSRVLRFGGLTAGVGLAAGLLSNNVPGTVIGCALVGVGMAGIVPIIFTAAGNQPGISAGNAVSKVAGVAFAGSLIGPPLIGLMAEATSLKVALLLVAAAGLTIGIVGPLTVRPVRTAHRPS